MLLRELLIEKRFSNYGDTISASENCNSIILLNNKDQGFPIIPIGIDTIVENDFEFCPINHINLPAVKTTKSTK